MNNRNKTIPTASSFYEECSDWSEAWSCGLRDKVESVMVPNRDAIRKDGLEPENISKVHAFYEGENDSESWGALVEMKDGRFVAMEAWCDYTGWGCQDGGSLSVALNKRDALMLGFSEDMRKKLLEVA